MDGGDNISSVEYVEVTEVSESPEVDVASSGGYDADENYEDCEVDNEPSDEFSGESVGNTENYDDCGLEGGETEETADLDESDEKTDEYEYYYDDCELSKESIEGEEELNVGDVDERLDHTNNPDSEIIDETDSTFAVDDNTDDEMSDEFNEEEATTDDLDKEYNEFGEEPKLRDDIKDNPEFVDENGDIKWPENDGFAGEPENVTLEPGTVIDRYGSEEGRFTADVGTPYVERSLPFDESTQEYHSYDVIEPIENVQQGETADAFNQPGGGTQQKLPESVSALVENGKLRRI